LSRELLAGFAVEHDGTGAVAEAAMVRGAGAAGFGAVAAGCFDLFRSTHCA
jgi:hypothetical protein